MINFYNIQGLIIIETELWPGLLYSATRKIPVFVFNARISDSSYNSFKFQRPILSNALAKVTAIYTYSDLNKQRLETLGASTEVFRQVNSMKFLAPSFHKEKQPVNELLRYCHQDPKGIVLVCGSVQLKEIELIKQAIYLTGDLRSSITVVFIPKDIKVIDDIKADPEFDRKKDLIWSPDLSGSDYSPYNSIYIDAYGSSMDWYSVADLVFVGGSLAENRGGQNMIEPLFLGKPVFIGDKTPNFREEVRILKERDLLQIVKDGTQITHLIEDFALRRDGYKSMGMKAKEFVLQMSEKTSGDLKGFINHFVEEVKNN